MKRPPPPPAQAPEKTTDRIRYNDRKICVTKARYETFAEAVFRGQYVYACNRCQGFHRTMKPLDAASQLRLIERLFGPLTPAKISAFNDLTQEQIATFRTKSDGK